jgi:HK97 gp10 family phage protein
MPRLSVRENVQITGYLETAALLRELPARVAKKGLRAAVTAGSTPVMRAVRAGAPQVTNLLKTAIGRKVKTYKSGRVAAIIGARVDIQTVTQDARGTRRQVPANYFHLVEGGARPHSEAMKSGQVIFHPGVAANPFMRRAYEANKTRAGEAAAAKLRDVVEAEARKLGKR